MNYISEQLMFKHKFNLVNKSQLPFIAISFTMLLTMSSFFYLHLTSFSCVLNWEHFIFHLSTFVLIYIILNWFLIIVFDSAYVYYTIFSKYWLPLGFCIFLVYELKIFLCIFWTYFYYKLNTSVSMTDSWAFLFNLTKLDTFNIPLSNKLIVLSSGYTLFHKMHRARLETTFNQKIISHNWFINRLFLITILGYIFLICQLLEYTYDIPFSWSYIYWILSFLLTKFSITVLFLILPLISAISLGFLTKIIGHRECLFLAITCLTANFFISLYFIIFISHLKLWPINITEGFFNKSFGLGIYWELMFRPGDIFVIIGVNALTLCFNIIYVKFRNLDNILDLTKYQFLSQVSFYTFIILLLNMFYTAKNLLILFSGWKHKISYVIVQLGDLEIILCFT